MKIGIFGGSFNPPHLGHLQIALESIEQGYVDRVIFVPTGDLYSKPDLASAKDRYQMLLLFTEGYPFFEVSDYEVRNGRKYTYQTLQHFQKKYPSSKLYFLMGMDNLLEFPTWKEARWMLREYHLLVTARDGTGYEDLQKKYETYDTVCFTSIKTLPISSSQIRADGKLGFANTSSYLVPKELRYIKEKHLYQDL